MRGRGDIVAPVTERIESDRLALVPLRPEDADEMSRVLADPALYEFTGGGPQTADELKATYRRWAEGAPRAGETWHNWVIRVSDDGTAIGHIQATVTDGGRSADIAWVVGLPWQGQGYASEAAQSLLGWLETNGVEVITAHVHPRNVASRRVAAKAGLAPTNEIVDGEAVWRRDGPRPG